MKCTVCRHPRAAASASAAAISRVARPLTSQARVHPKALQLTTVAPGPSAYARYDLAGIADEDGQVDFFTKPRGVGRFTADLGF